MTIAFLEDRERIGFELRENGLADWPAGWTLWHLGEVLAAEGIDPNRVQLHGCKVVVMRAASVSAGEPREETT